MLATTITALEAIRRINESAAQPELRICETTAVGQVPGHQGDLYIHRVEDGFPIGEVWGNGSRQVALGDTTGSRHIAEGDDVTVFHSKKLPDWIRPAAGVPEDRYRGPVVRAPKGFRLTHPEHAHHDFPAGTYFVSYQVDVTRAMRVQD